MGKFKDLTGLKFGRLTVIERAENKGRHTCWKCRCDCGNNTVTESSQLRNGRAQSCGCLKTEKFIKMASKNKHGMTRTKIYNTWISMKDRCLKSKAKSFLRYGGRGISIYLEWIDDFQAFYDYVSALPHFGEEGYSLDRIDNNGNYEPDNLRWADRKTQGRNKRNNIIVEYNGKKMTLVEAAELSGISYKTFHFRYTHGDRGEKLFRPVRHKARSSNS